MIIKLDENLPIAVAAQLTNLGHDVDTVQDEGLQGYDDDAVWLGAQRDGRFLITQDLDFSDLRRYVFSEHCGLMIVRLHETGLNALSARISDVFQSSEQFDWANSLVIVTDHKIRVRRVQLNG